MTTFTSNQVETIIISLYVSSILNLLGSSFTIITYLLFKDARTYSTSLIFYLSLSDFCSGLADSPIWVMIETEERERIYCSVQGSLLMFGLCASMLWGFFIGVHIFLVVYKDMEMEDIKKYQIFFHAIAWGYPTFAFIYPLVKNDYVLAFPDNKNSWCFVPEKYRMLMIFPDTVIFFLLIIIYLLNHCKLRSTKDFAATLINKQMSIYLFVFTIINVFAIINRMQEFFSTKTFFTLYLLQFITEPLQGFLNAFAYVWNEPEYVGRYKSLFSNCVPQKTTISINQEENEKLMSLVCYDPIP